MADYEIHQPHHQTVPTERTLQALNTIIQLHFEKTLEKKRSIDLQKKELHKLFLLFFIFLSLIFLAQSQSPRLQCRHCWVPITLLSLAQLVFYVSVAQTLRCINGFKYQRRCHKLTLGLATEKLREMKIRFSNSIAGGDGYEGIGEDDFEIQYQEPPESYFVLKSMLQISVFNVEFGAKSLVLGRRKGQILNARQRRQKNTVKFGYLHYGALECCTMGKLSTVLTAQALINGYQATVIS